MIPRKEEQMRAEGRERENDKGWGSEHGRSHRLVLDQNRDKTSSFPNKIAKAFTSPPYY